MLFIRFLNEAITENCIWIEFNISLSSFFFGFSNFIPLILEYLISSSKGISQKIKIFDDTIDSFLRTLSRKSATISSILLQSISTSASSLLFVKLKNSLWNVFFIMKSATGLKSFSIRKPFSPFFKGPKKRILALSFFQSYLKTVLAYCIRCIT